MAAKTTNSGAFRRRVVAPVALVGLLATACGGADETSTAAPLDSVRNTPAESSQPIAESTTAAVGSPSAEVLAFAIQAAEDQTYSFQQGLSMRMNIFGQQLDVATDGPLATGIVSGDDQSINMDIGGFMVAMFESFGLDANDPLFGGALAEFQDIEMDMWVVDDQLVMDFSDFTGAFGDLDPAAASELSIFANGPVSIDLDRLAELGVDQGVAASDIANQFGQGVQITDPADIVSALRSVDALNEVGSDVVNGFDVTVYDSTVSLGEFSRAIGQDTSAALGQLGDLRIDEEAILAELEAIEVEMTIMLDGEGLVRQLITTMDMGSFVSSTLGEHGGFGSSADAEMLIETWQTFDDYGVDFDVVAPEATDVTSELAGLIDS